MIRVISILIFTMGMGCQKPPSISPAAMPSSAVAMAPMGSLTSNGDFNKRMQKLEVLLTGQAIADINDPDLAAIFEVIPAELFREPIRDALKKELLRAELYFHERRFIEAAQSLSRILDQSPYYPRARNLLARCFYFLGNSDRAILELEYIVVHQFSDSDEVLDALFLMGATAHESDQDEQKRLQKGIKAWETYLKIAKASPQRQRVEQGLLQLRQRAKDIKSAVHKKSAALQPVMKGSHLEQVIAQGQQAFEAQDLLLAQAKFQEALRMQKNDPHVSTMLARILIQTGRAREAIELFEKTVQRHPSFVEAWHYKGMAHMLGGDPKAAVHCWETVLRLNPTYAEQFQLEGRIAIAKQMIR